MEIECESHIPVLLTNLSISFHFRDTDSHNSCMSSSGWQIHPRHFSQQVVFTSSASLVLFIVVYFILGLPSKIPESHPVVEGTTILEMLWVGSHMSDVRRRLQAIGHPSPEELRSGRLFDVNLMEVQGVQESSHAEAAPLLNSSTFEFGDVMQGVVSLDLDFVNVTCSLRLFYLCQGRGHSSTQVARSANLQVLLFHLPNLPRPYLSNHLNVFGATYCMGSSFLSTSCCR